MFETHESGKVDVPVQLSDPGISLWDYAFTRINVEWFHVVCKTTEDDGDYQPIRNFFLTQAEHVQEFNQSPDWEILEVQIVSPSYINASGHWDMELVELILRGVDSSTDTGQHGFVYVVNGGRRYVRSLTNDEKDLVGLEQLYSRAE